MSQKKNLISIIEYEVWLNNISKLKISKILKKETKFQKLWFKKSKS